MSMKVLTKIETPVCEPQRKWEVLGWVGRVKINSDISLLPADDKWWHIYHCSGIVSVYILILHQTDKCYWWSTQASDECFILLVWTCNYTGMGVELLSPEPQSARSGQLPPPAPNLITLHTCGNAVGVVKRERETEWTVNKLAFKQDNLGLRVLGAKQNTAMENWYKLLTHGSRQESLNQGGKARCLSKELFN